MFGHVFLRLFGRFYPRKLLGHDALNEYLRRADRSWYSEATIGRNAPINSNVRGLRGIDVAGKGTNDDHDADDQDGDDDHDARDNAVSMLVRNDERRAPVSAGNEGFHRMMHLRGSGATRGRIDGISILGVASF